MKFEPTYHTWKSSLSLYLTSHWAIFIGFLQTPVAIFARVITRTFCWARLRTLIQEYNLCTIDNIGLHCKKIKSFYGLCKQRTHTHMAWAKIYLDVSTINHLLDVFDSNNIMIDISSDLRNHDTLSICEWLHFTVLILSNVPWSTFLGLILRNWATQNQYDAT